MRAKICGITNLDDACYAVQCGAWALGFNFYSKSPRWIEPNAAASIIRQLPSNVLKVGIVVDTNHVELETFMTDVGLDLIQVYQPMNVSLSLKQRMILCVHAAVEEDLPSHDVLSEYGYVLLDAPKLADGLLGGTGRLSHWTLAATLAQRYRLLLAGGLTPSNVQTAIQTVQPYAVDVASGVQCTPARVSHSLLFDFLRQVNHAS